MTCLFSKPLLSAQVQYPPKSNNTQIEETRTELTEEEALTKRAEMFGLTLKEWRRFDEILKGPQGKKNPNIDPVMALGIYAKDSAERQRYAELAVQNDYQHFGQVLAFQRSYNAAQERLYGHLEVIAGSPNKRIKSNQVKTFDGSVIAGDRLMYFTSMGCHTCEKDVNTILDFIKKRPGVGADIYVIGTGKDNQKVQQWAREQRIPAELVKARIVTLNHDNGTLMQIDSTRTAPTVILRRGNEFKDFDKVLGQ